jgi:hypothetical protein
LIVLCNPESGFANWGLQIDTMILQFAAPFRWTLRVNAVKLDLRSIASANVKPIGHRHKPRQWRRKENRNMSRNFVVYESRNRLTGTLTQMLDTKHADAAKLKLPDGARYIALCVEHKTAVRFAEHYPAGRAIAHVDEWCKDCQSMIAKKQSVRGANQAPKAPTFDVAEKTALLAAIGKPVAKRNTRNKPRSAKAESAAPIVAESAS